MKRAEVGRVPAARQEKVPPMVLVESAVFELFGAAPRVLCAQVRLAWEAGGGLVDGPHAVAADGLRPGVLRVVEALA